MPGWMVCPRSLNRYMTAPQQRAANNEKCCWLGGTGFTGEVAVDAMVYGDSARGMKDATTREQTYSTIYVKGQYEKGRQIFRNRRILTCSLTAFRSPKTK